MASTVTILISVIFIYICTCEDHIRPIPVPMCHTWNQTCLESSAMAGLKLLQQPHPEVGLPSLDPLHIKRIHVHPQRKSNVRYSQDYYDMEFRGMSSAQVKNFSVVVTSSHVHMNFSLYMNKFEMISWYRWTGVVMSQHVNGYGLGNITSINVTHEHMLTLKRNSNDVLSIMKYRVDLKPTILLFDLPNLVKGDPEASLRAEQLFNDNGMAIFHQVKDDYDRMFGKIFYPCACAFFRNIRLQDLFLDANEE